VKKWLWTILLILLIIIGIAYAFMPKENAAATSVVKTEAAQVIVQKAVQVSVPENVTAIGSIYSKQTVNINPQISGQIKSIVFKDGQAVKKGQVLYQLDDSFYQAQYAAAKADLQLAHFTYERNLILVKKKIVSQQAFDQAFAIYQHNQAKLQESAVQLAETKINVPFDGVIGASQVSLGQFVTTGDALVELVDNVHLVVRYSVPENYFEQIQLEQTVQITSSAYPGKIFQGKVSYIAPTIDPETRTLPVWADITNSESLLVPGLFVNVQEQIGIIPQAIVVPQAALIPTIDGNDVYIIKNNIAYKKAVVVGNTFGEQIIIKSGLSAGDEVVIAGQEKLSEGTAVAVVNS